MLTAAQGLAEDGRPQRHLDWDGCFNTRDLGGLPAHGGRLTLTHALIRSDAPSGLSPAGWRSVHAHGIRTLIDLRTDAERDADPICAPPGLSVVPVPLEDHAEPEFARWGPLLSTPLYYAPFLERFPERVAAVLEAIAWAPPGGVLFHCASGRDRTGLISLLLLSLAGVAPEEIVADYEISCARVVPLFEKLGKSQELEQIARIFSEAGTSPREILFGLLESLDVEAYLRQCGVSDDTRRLLRGRLI